MSSVQPEDGLPVRRLITADSFRALKIKLSGTKPLVPAAPPPCGRGPEPVAPAEAPPPVAPASEPESIPAAAHVEVLPQPAAIIAASPVAPALDAPEPCALVEPEPPQTETVSENPVAVTVETQERIEPDAVTQTQSTVSVLGEEAAAEPLLPPARGETPVASVPVKPLALERRVLEMPQQEDPEAGARAHALIDIMAMPTSGSLPQERALANDTLLRLIPRMPLKSLRHLAERVGLMEAPSQMLVRRLINDPRIEVSGPLLENAMTVDDSDLIAVVNTRNPEKLRLMARRRIISPALSEALILSNHPDTLLNLVRNQGASFSIESMWRLTRAAAEHPMLQAPLVTRQDTPSPIAFQLFWRLPSELRRYVLSRFLTDSETISRILTMNAENEGAERKYADLSLLSRLENAASGEAGAIYAELVHVSRETGARIAEDQGGEALTVALKAAGLTRTQFAGIVDRRSDAEALKAIFDTLSFNKARVLLTYWDWAARRTGPYARIAAA